jgi:hypothetical protein
VVVFLAENFLERRVEKSALSRDEVFIGAELVRNSKISYFEDLIFDEDVIRLEIVMHYPLLLQ